MIIIKCRFCKKKIKTYPSRVGRKNYCSYSCAAKSSPNLFKKGVPHLWAQGENHPNWNGGKQKHALGYVSIFSPFHPYKNVRKTVLEHRLIMEQHLKRFLLPSEVVHHKNGIKNDNRIENLELFSSNSSHIKNEYVNNETFRTSIKKTQFKKGCKRKLKKLNN